jgi:hypothetical protein
VSRVGALRSGSATGRSDNQDPALTSSPWLTHDIVWVSDQRMPGGGIFEGKDATKRYLDGLGVSKHEALDVEGSSTWATVFSG